MHPTTLLLEKVSPVSAAVAGFVLLLSAIYCYTKKRNTLPGPTGLPYLGLFPFLNNNKAFLQLEEYGKKYGDLYSFTYLGSLVINLGSAKALREVLLNKADNFASKTATFNILGDILKDGIMMSNGESWKFQRKFFIRSFKAFGLTGIKENTLGPIFNSVSATIEDLKTRKGVPLNMIELLTKTCSETFRKVVFGGNISNEIIYKITEEFATSLECFVGMKALLFGPIGRFIFNTVPNLRKAVHKQNKMKELLLKAIKTVEFNTDDSISSCVVEDWYVERKKRREQNDKSWQYFTDKALVESLVQIVGDGIHGVSYFIGCFFHALAQYPSEQDKIFKEVIEVVGTNRLPEPDDKKKLPYTNAFMNEVIRTSNFFTLFPSVECTKETTVRGYRIPKGSITLLNIWQAHHDCTVYENPDNFDPARFLASEGKPKVEMPVSFGLGRRSCVGEPYVMLQVFLFLTSIVKNFVISDPNQSKETNHFLMTGVIELSFTSRN